ncbi:unnamed protein product [Rotaria sp. Silwood1]|nr:unnamed protein product [Rotaria sp. Silwood1]CAF4979463.1 unnamed protein product [Rotaria sp. Silwood1]
MPAIQRNDSTVSSASTVWGHTNVTHFIVQHSDNAKIRKIVHMNKILNPSNRRLKVGDDCTLKGDGRNHTRVKILFCDTCQHQLDIIDSTSAIISSKNDAFNKKGSSPLGENMVNKCIARTINSAPKASPVQSKNVQVPSSFKDSGTSKAVTHKTKNKKNCKSYEQEIDMLGKDDDIHHSKEVSTVTMSQSRNPVQLPTSNTFVARNVSNQVLTQKSSKRKTRFFLVLFLHLMLVSSSIPEGHFDASSSRDSMNYGMDFETLDSNKKQSTMRQDDGNEDADIAAERSANDELFNLSNDKYDDDCGILEDSEADQTTTTNGKSAEKQVKKSGTYDELLVKYQNLSERYKRLKNQVTYLQEQNEMLNATMLPMPPPEIQQWFVHTAQRFENKPLSGTVLRGFSTALDVPVNILISLKQNTGTLTARAIVRHLFPSKSRTMDDMTDDIRQSILDFVKYCHPNEFFVRGKINEAINGPFRTANYAAVKRVLEQKATKNIKSDIFQICQNCNKVYQNVCGNTQCCSDVSQAQSPAFLKFQVKDQIHSILASENNFTLHSSSSSCYSNCITDIQHANWYQSIALNEDTSNFITLFLNVDGISMSDSSDNSLWIFTVS